MEPDTHHKEQQWKYIIEGVSLRISKVASGRSLLELAQAKVQKELIVILDEVRLDCNWAQK